jgi:PAS domain S-box-containing protein
MIRRTWQRSVSAMFRSVRLEALVVAALIMALLGTWAVSNAVEQQVEASGIQAKRADSLGLARLLAQQWRQSVQQIAYLNDLAGLSIEAETDGSASLAPPDTVRQALTRIGDGIQQVSARDASGHLLWSTTPVAPAAPEAAPGRSAERSNRLAARPVIGPRGQPAIAFTAEHHDFHGTLLGTSTVLADANLVRMLREKTDLLRGSIVILMRSDGAVLAYSLDAADAARGMAEAAPLRNTLARGQSDLMVRDPADGLARFYGLAPVPGADIYVAVGLSEADAMAPVNAAVGQVHRWALALCFVLVAMAFVVNIVFRNSRSLSLERQRSHELHQRETMLREIAETASDVIIILDERMRALFVNPAYRTILGGDPTLASGQRIGERILPDDFDQVRLGVAALRERAGSWRGTYRVRHEDGSIRWLESEIVSVCSDEVPNGARFVAISRDVTGRIQDEAALKVAQAELNALVRLGPGTFYRMTIGNDGEPARWFPAGCEMLRVATSDRQADGIFRERVYAADRALLTDAVARCLDTGDATAEYRLAGPDQELRWVRDRMRLVKGSHEENVLFGYITEITQEREDMGRLRQVERLATLGEVAAGIAHEMNQPLAAIAMAAENGLRLLNDGAESIAIAAKLSRIADHAHRLSQITDAVCLFGRADGNTVWAAVLGDVLGNVRVLVKPRLIAAGAELIVDAPPHLPLIKASPVALEQALLNLIANSCDAYASHPRASATCDIRLCAQVEADHLRITVADQAGGIPAGVIDRIFNPFFTTKEPGKGTGLGLSISYARITETGGRMSVRNRDGGATFDILLPLLPMAQPVEARLEARLEAPVDAPMEAIE